MTYRPAWKAKAKPYEPPDHDEHVMYAWRALKDGIANDGQQKLIYQYILHVTSWTDLSFRPGTEGRRDTDFAEGKRFVGHNLLKLEHPSLTEFYAKPKTETKGKA